MKELTEQGKKVMLNSLHAALGHRGSMTTLVNLKAEIDGDKLKIIDSAEGLKTFRELWALAVHEGRRQQEETSGQLLSDGQALAAENSRLEGVATETEKRANDYLAAKSAAEAEFLRVRTRLESELSDTKTALVHAGEQARMALNQLAQSHVAHLQDSTSTTQG